MNCTVTYGISHNIKHTKTMTIADAFRFINNGYGGYAYCDVYYNDRLIYTTQGLAGYSFICEDCPYYAD